MKVYLIALKLAIIVQTKMKSSPDGYIKENIQRVIPVVAQVIAWYV